MNMPEGEMNYTDKREYYYKLWEFHANLLWNKIQYIVAIVIGIYTGWFILFQLFMKENRYDYLYFALAEFLNVFGILICYNFYLLGKRDIDIQKNFEEKLSDIFGEIKSDDRINKKTRGRYVFQRLIKICMGSCLILLIFSVICFYIK